MSGSRRSSSSRQQSGSSSRISDDQIIDLVSKLREVFAEILERCSDRGCHCEAWSMPPTSPDERPTPGALKKFLEESEAWNSNLDSSGLEKIETIGEKSLPDNLRDEKKGKLPARSIAESKGKAAATSCYDTGESSNNTSSLNSTFQTENHQRYELDHLSIPLARHKFETMTDRNKHAGANADASAGANGRSLNGHTIGTMVIIVKEWCYPLPHPPLPASAGRNEQAHLQVPNAKCGDTPSVGTVCYQQSPENAATGADIEAGASIICPKPPLETIAIPKELPVGILISGAFALLSRDPETFRGPVERFLLGVMMVGFICSFTCLLMGDHRRRGRLSSLLQWTTVLAIFVSFFLVMALLMTH